MIATMMRDNQLLMRSRAAAEPATTRRVLVQRGAKVALVEVRPELVDEDELRVGHLPKQEIRDAQLAARPDQQVGIGQVRGVQVGGEDVLVDVRGVDTALDESPC